MAWVRLDDGFTEHPKVLKAGPLGLAMQVAAIAYCNRNLTDGFVPRQAASRLLDFSGLGMRMWAGDMVGGGEDATWELVVEDLESAGLWDCVDGGWLIHDYLEYQPSKADVLAERKKTKERVTRWRERNAATNAVGNANCNAAPLPDPLPDPELKKEQEKRVEASPKAPRSAGSRLTIENLPEDWRLYCRNNHPKVDPDRTWTEFRDYWIARAGEKARKADWLATWRTWLRKAEDFNRGLIPNGQQRKPSDLDNRRATAEAIDEVVALAEARQRGVEH